MPNKFVNTQDFGGVDLSKLPDKIGDNNASDCNGIDFSLEKTIKTTGCGPSIGGVKTGTGYSNGDMYVFKKAFGTAKEVVIRSFKDTTDNSMRLEWFNEDLSLTNYGRWERMYDESLATTVRFGFAPVNGDNGTKINRLIIGGTEVAMLVWNGATAQVTNWGANQIVTNRTSLVDEGFEVHPNKANEIMVNGTLYTYTGISGGTFTGVTPNPATTSPALKDGITQNCNDELMLENTVTKSDITFTAGTNGTISGANGSFLNDFWIGQKLYIQGAINANNNGIFTIYNISPDNKTITVEESTLVNEVNGGTTIFQVGAPRGSIVYSSQGKLWISGVSGLESKVYYSVTGVATCFAITTGLASGGSFDLVEGGGYITALNAIGQNKLVVHKRDSCTIYTRSIDTSSNVIESFDIASTGVGIGAAGQNAITSYGKTTYYLSSGGEIRTIKQSIYSTETFSFGDISANAKNLLNIVTPTNAYLIYDSRKNRLVLSTNSVITTSSSTSEYLNLLVYIYISKGVNGYEYKISFDSFNYNTSAVDTPIVITTQTTPPGLWLYQPILRNVYLWGSDIINYDIQKNPYHVSKEFTFGEPAQDKVFDILNIDGYLYNNTIIKFTVLYGVGGKDGTKSYYINKNSDCVTDVVTYNNDYNLLGDNAIVNNYYQNGIGQSYYFKLPLHIDVNRSDRYQIRIETHNSSVVNTFWAVNNISTNATLKDVNMNNLLNQNEVSLDGIGVMEIGSTNIVG